MTVTSQINSKSYTVSEGQTLFSYDFMVWEENDMVLTLDGAPYGDPFTLSTLKDDAGGFLTLSVPITADQAGKTLTMTRVTDNTQEHDYSAFDGFPAESHEGALDKLTLQLIDLLNKTNQFSIVEQAAPYAICGATTSTITGTTYSPTPDPVVDWDSEISNLFGIDATAGEAYVQQTGVYEVFLTFGPIITTPTSNYLELGLYVNDVEQFFTQTNNPTANTSGLTVSASWILSLNEGDKLTLSIKTGFGNVDTASVQLAYFTIYRCDAVREGTVVNVIEQTQVSGQNIVIAGARMHLPTLPQFSVDDGLATVVGQSSWIVDNAYNMSVEPINDLIRIIKDGLYRIAVSITCEVNNKNRVINWDVTRNGVSVGTTVMNKQEGVFTVNLNITTPLVEHDVLQLKAQTESSSVDVDIREASFALLRLNLA